MAILDEADRYEALMERMAKAYRGKMARVCKACELTPPQFWALHTLRDLGTTKMSPLADHLGLSMGAASTLIDRLVSRGLVERCADASDRRAVYVSLTDKGREVFQQAAGARVEVARLVFKQLPPETREQFLTGLGAMVEAWERLSGEPSRDAAG